MALVAAVGLLPGTAPRAHSDHPAAILVGSGVVAGGVILGASIVASAILLDDVLTTEPDDDCDCPETRTEGDGEGGEEGGGGEGEGGGEEGGGAGAGKRVRGPSRSFESRGASVTGSATKPAAASFDDSTTHARVTSFIDRKGELRVQRAGNGYATASAGYTFDGNVMKAPRRVRKFTHGEALVFDLKLDTRAIRDPQACATLTFNDLHLSTEDVPKTDGAVQMIVVVYEKGVKKTTRELTLRQGSTPQRPPWASGSGWSFAKDRIDITNATLALPCTPDAAGEPTDLKVAVNLKFMGERK